MLFAKQIIGKPMKIADKYLRIVMLGSFLLILMISSPFSNQSKISRDTIEVENPQDNNVVSVPSNQEYSSLHLNELTPPEIKSSQADVSINEGDPLQIRWDIDDAFPDKYVIYRNATEVANGPYAQPSTVYHINTSLGPGVYNYTIFANDTSANSVTDTAYITILDITPPILVDTGNFNITESSTGNEIPWTATELNPSHYIIYRNQTQVKTGLWNSSGETIMYNIDYLSVGVYNFTIEMYDSSNNNGTDYVIIQVTDEASPVVLSSIVPLRFSEFDVGINLIVNVTDSHPDNYLIYQNGIAEPVQNGTWTNGTLIIYNLDYLAIGNYTFSILLFDEYFNNIQIDIDVEIYKVIFVESLAPQFSIATQVREGDYETIQSNWLDFQNNPITNGNITLTLYQDQLLVDQIYYLNHTNTLGAFDLVLNYTGLPVSDYRWEILFEGIEYISQTLKFNFTVLPHIYDIIVSDMGDLNQGKEYEIEISVIYANSQSSLRLNSLVENTGVASDVEVNFNMLVTLIDGGQSTISQSGSSNVDGKIIFTLSIFETSLIASIDSITLETVDNQFSNPTSVNLPVEEFPVIITTGTQTTSTTTSSSISSNSDTESTSNGNQGNESQILEDYLFIILGGILGLFFVIFLIGKMRKSKRLQIEDEQSVYNLSLAEVKGISTIQLVLLTSKTGLPLYERKFKTMGVDTVLLSGVTSAISSILSEASDQQIFGLEIMESSGLSITSHKSNYSSLIFISSTSIPMIVLSQMIEAHETIEKKYGEKLVSDGSTAIPEEEINKIFRDHQLKLDLSSDIEIDLVALEKFHTSGKAKNGVKSLAGVLLDIDINELEMQDVGRLIEIYEEEGFESNYAANFILYAYKEGLIKSKIK
ncbi:MAG: hypothetical protein GPJ54_19040 [Candidatus Heimdallarchaeota archaeon]|nr:hypothetical protein [Candidatus Heimdallarchaeota archaeon]